MVLSDIVENFGLLKIASFFLQILEIFASMLVLLKFLFFLLKPHGFLFVRHPLIWKQFGSDPRTDVYLILLGECIELFQYYIVGGYLHKVRIKEDEIDKLLKFYRRHKVAENFLKFLSYKSFLIWVNFHQFF